MLQSVAHVSVASPATKCDAALRKLIVPRLEHVVMKRQDIQVALEDSKDGIYSVKLFVASDSPDNLDKYVTTGWVDLDVNTMKAFDVTDDPDKPTILDVDMAKYRKYVDQCLRARP